MTINQEQFEQYFVNMSIENFGSMDDFTRRRFQLDHGASRFKKHVIGGGLKTLLVNSGKVNRNIHELKVDLASLLPGSLNHAKRDQFIDYISKEGGAKLSYLGKHHLEFKKVSSDDSSTPEFLITYLSTPSEVYKK